MSTTQMTMMAVAKDSAGPGLAYREAPVPRPGSGEVLIRVTAASICGTDSLIYDWADWAAARLVPPRIIGHEFAGEVVEAGQGATRFSPGQRVSAESHIFCGRCKQCTTGSQEVCRELKILGVDLDGAFSQYLTMPAVNIWPNHPAIQDTWASMQEPLGNAVDTVLAEDVDGKSVLITGAGPMGLMCASVARACGATLIVVSDPNPYRLDLAKTLGADLTVNPAVDSLTEAVMERTNGNGVDVFLEISGSESAITDGLKSLTPGGRASLLGITKGPVNIALNELVIFRRIRIYGITGRKVFGTWHTVSNLLSSGRLNMDPLITHELPMREYETAFGLMSSGRCGKIILTP